MAEELIYLKLFYRKISKLGFIKLHFLFQKCQIRIYVSFLIQILYFQIIRFIFQLTFIYQNQFYIFLQSNKTKIFKALLQTYFKLESNKLQKSLKLNPQSLKNTKTLYLHM